MSEDLKPCPFCGAEAKRHPCKVTFVGCSNSACAWFVSSDYGIGFWNHWTKWNTRPTEQQQAARIAELESDRDRYKAETERLKDKDRECDMWHREFYRMECENSVLAANLNSATSELATLRPLAELAPELAGSLESMLKSAHPHPEEHPAMNSAWLSGSSALAKFRALQPEKPE